MHVKDHTIPLPTRGRPGEYRIRLGGLLYIGPRDECAAIGTAVERAADNIAGDRAVAAVHEVEYRETWAPLLARKSLPGYIASVVPEWASEMHGRVTADA